MKIIAPAKLNLCLHIIGKRTDHYHLIESLFVFTQWGDEIQVSAHDTLLLSVDGEFQNALDVDNDHNLVMMAARELQMGNTQEGARIQLTKNIPVGAGLGGGSSDVAAVLIALNQLWNLSYDLDALAEIGLKIGADVPACIYQHAAWVSGIGDIIEPIALPVRKIFVVLVNNKKILSTKTVFEQYHENQTDYDVSLPVTYFAAKDEQGWWEKLSETRNALESVADRIYPDIATVLAILQQQPHCKLARMSGSGGTCFALFTDELAAITAEKHMKKLYPEYWTTVTSVKVNG